ASRCGNSVARGRSTRSLEVTEMQRIALALAIGVCAISATAEPTGPIPHEIQTWLDQYAASHPTYRGMPAGPPQPENVLLAYGDLNSDHREDAVIVFPMEVGGSGWVQYAAAFSRGADRLKFCCIAKVGEKGSTKVESV